VKYIIIFILNISILLSGDTFEIKSIKNNILILNNQKSLNLKIGQSGFVISDYKYLEFINASIYITKITKDYIYTTIIEKNPFKKENLAYINKAISVEDKVVFNMYDNKTFLIAPNKTSYLKIKNYLKKDLLFPQFILTQSGNFGINKSDFIKIAKKFLIGNFYIAYDNKLVNIDAFSLKVLDTTNIKFDTYSYEQPFFSFSKDFNIIINMTKLITRFNYNKYYTKLVQNLDKGK
jgi:hypothetical protein